MSGLAENAVMEAAADADLLVVARDSRHPGPHSIGHAARFVVDHAPCDVVLVWPGGGPDGPAPKPEAEAEARRETEAEAEAEAAALTERRGATNSACAPRATGPDRSLSTERREPRAALGDLRRARRAAPTRRPARAVKCTVSSVLMNR